VSWRGKLTVVWGGEMLTGWMVFSSTLLSDWLALMPLPVREE
jgi:hypothetical protein